MCVDYNYHQNELNLFWDMSLLDSVIKDNHDKVLEEAMMWRNKCKKESFQY